MTRDLIDRSKDWSFVPRSLAARGLSDDLIRRVFRWESEDPVRAVAEVLLWAAELVPQGLRLPVVERYVRSTRALGEASPKTERQRRTQALSASWRATAAEELRALATEVGTGGEPESAEPARRDACLFAEWVLRQSHILGLVGAAERDPESLHFALADEDRERVRDLMLGTFWPAPALDETVSRWNRFVVDLDHWGYDEYADFLSTRDNLGAAEATVSPDAAAMLGDRYAAIDRLYIEQTEPIEHAINDGPRRWSPRGWWWYRAPQNMDANFAAAAGLHVADGQARPGDAS